MLIYATRNNQRRYLFLLILVFIYVTVLLSGNLIVFLSIDKTKVNIQDKTGCQLYSVSKNIDLEAIEFLARL